ncbi:hypothetical protein L3556_16165 [Candidatus Synechococcus calcipolaris G9]|uniref:Uncharacterized protein n=1 Tax=Candidatus Synechococcus calcipolaris G9 TaxID=1497997 RepID=A0ABT6F3K5_9SYNE|nr:hypothetical protein [Candidatus Synechococcus calcipolaris]MDG2992454.1 hypothetical protein [Candidatus Synechococcus calcipolaris G9]
MLWAATGGVPNNDPASVVAIAPISNKGELSLTLLVIGGFPKSTPAQGVAHQY